MDAKPSLLALTPEMHAGANASCHMVAATSIAVDTIHIKTT